MKTTATLVSTSLIASAFLCTSAIAFGQDEPKIIPVPLKPRVVFPKPGKAVFSKPNRFSSVVLKLVEGSGVRLEDGRLFADSKLSPRDLELLKRAGVTEEQLRIDIDAINKLLANVTFESLFTTAEEKLAYDKLQGEVNSGDELADRSLYFSLFPSVPQFETLINQLNALPSVEIAYLTGLPSLPAMDIPPATPDLTEMQGYLNEASNINPFSNGIDARYAWSREARGQGVRIIDIEGGWNRAHEDLGTVIYSNGIFSQDIPPIAFEPIDYTNHGTAAVGIVAAADNSYGVTGIASSAETGMGSFFFNTFEGTRPIVARAIENARTIAALQPGDVIQLEVAINYSALPEAEILRPSGTCTPLSNNPRSCAQFGDLPIEFERATFDAISTATRNGIIVVEAAGNGWTNLDERRYQLRSNHSDRDSGAIIVGAGCSSLDLSNHDDCHIPRSPHPWSNTGNRVDVQGWGDSVMTLGYGHPASMRFGGDVDQNQWYMRGFGGTSSATAIVTGAAAVLQGYLRDQSRPILNSSEMRELLAVTGMRQTGSRHVGPLPNLRAAFANRRVGAHPRLIAERRVQIRERDVEMDTGLDIRPGDSVLVLASGAIWSGEWSEGLHGVLFDVRNGPQGWLTHKGGSRFPLPAVPPYSLIGRFDGTPSFYIGRSSERRYTGSAPTRLFLRINDDIPANGSGEFTALVQVHR